MKTFGATCVRRAHRTKNLRNTAARAANHPALIRSFLIESSPRTPFARQISKNIFACADVGAARDVDRESIAMSRKNFSARIKR
jgi:hypothetical protein